MLVATGIAILCSVNLLSGDDQGRVNLLHLIVLFVGFPILGFLVSVFSLIAQRPINSAYFITLLPIWSQYAKATQFTLKKQGMIKDWMLIQSQFAAITYSATGLACFLIALLLSDVNFIWRSTLLTSEQFFTVLTVLSWPWSYWDIAQPSLSLVEETKDSRLTQAYQNLALFGQWWPFLLATQLFYGLLPRLVLLIVSLVNIKNKQKIYTKKTAMPSKEIRTETFQPPPSNTYKAVVHTLPKRLLLVNWARFPYSDVEHLFTDVDLDTTLPSGALISENSLHIMQKTTVPALVLVKAWEPPLAELGDCMQISSGLLFPIDVIENASIENRTEENTVKRMLRKPNQKQMQEWQRFIEKYADWHIFQPYEWLNE